MLLVSHNDDNDIQPIQVRRQAFGKCGEDFGAGGCGAYIEM